MEKPCTLRYSPSQLVPYINWIYFFHTWGFTGKKGEEAEREKQKLKTEALELIHRMNDEGQCALFRFLLAEVHSQGDDIVLSPLGERIPFLRQQQPPYLSLADYINPQGDTIGLYVSTVPQEASHATLLHQTVCDRLAEAAAERGHQEVRKHYWGFAPDEDLTPEELFQEKYQGCRPAIGYPSLPDQSLNFLLAHLLDFDSAGVRLTESGAMLPHASTSGFIFSLPQAHHFSIRRIGEDQLQDYARRRGVEPDTLRKFLPLK